MFKALVIASVSLSLLACNYNPQNSVTPVRPVVSTSKAQLDDLLPPPKATFSLASERFLHCGDGLGTGVYIAPNMIMTAEHVVDGNKTCTDLGSGITLKPYYTDKATDFALLTGDTKKDPRFQAYSCDGFKAGKTYFSIGYAFGTDFIINKLVATSTYTDEDFIVEGDHEVHLRELKGTVIPGMSGGAIFDENGIVYGINNVTNYGKWDKAWSREIKDTVLCKH